MGDHFYRKDLIYGLSSSCKCIDIPLLHQHPTDHWSCDCTDNHKRVSVQAGPVPASHPSQRKVNCLTHAMLVYLHTDQIPVITEAISIYTSAGMVTRPTQNELLLSQKQSPSMLVTRQTNTNQASVFTEAVSSNIGDQADQPDQHQPGASFTKAFAYLYQPGSCFYRRSYYLCR